MQTQTAIAQTALKAGVDPLIRRMVAPVMLAPGLGLTGA